MNTYLLFVVVHWHDASCVKTTRHNTVIRRIDTKRVKLTRKCLKNFSTDLQNYSVCVTITEDTHPQPRLLVAETPPLKRPRPYIPDCEDGTSDGPPVYQACAPWGEGAGGALE